MKNYLKSRFSQIIWDSTKSSQLTIDNSLELTCSFDKKKEKEKKKRKSEKNENQRKWQEKRREKREKNSAKFASCVSLAKRLCKTSSSSGISIKCDRLTVIKEFMDGNEKKIPGKKEKSPKDSHKTNLSPSKKEKKKRK